MQKCKLLAMSLAFPVLVLGIWLASLHYDVVSSPKVYVAAAGYDPRDLLSGHYLNLKLLWDKTDCGQFPQAVCPQDRFERVYRFYVEEKSAAKLEKMINSRSPDIKLEFAFPEKAAPVLRQMLIDGKIWSEWAAGKI